ncbi:MFS general substrate transporter [Pisolithus orientalis]|uniref:MFS general substrate transporter n=1 Tax=Pisolithus orientalis TaxID=936130 RepID=UPI002224DE91|nr:MFS general substrate transporter [Pisolithus orientalis]KAI5995996.1 MFS general substrate transporter [Pisolithus orientalis]
MKQSITFDADDVRQDHIAGEKSEAGLSFSRAPVLLIPKEESQLWRKVDLKLMPIIALMYLLCFMDRGTFFKIPQCNAKLDGLMTQLGLDGNQYNVALTLFFIVRHFVYHSNCETTSNSVVVQSFSILDCPANYIIQFVPPSKWLAGTMVSGYSLFSNALDIFEQILWGLVMMSMGFVKTYAQLVGVRFCLGIAESGFYPGVAYYLTMWYPKYMLQRRFALFLGAATSAGAFSGILAYGINFMDGDGGYQGWSWIFILEGIATIVVGSVALFVMVDYPSTAKFLTPKEQQYITQRREFSEVDEKGDVAAQVRAAFTDWQVWAMCIVQMSITVPLYGITYFLPSIINNFGYTTSTSQLLSVPPYVFGVIVLLVIADLSDRMQRRSPFIFASQVIAIVGFIINITDVPNGVKYFGTYLCVAGPYTGGVGSIIWLANNLEGKCKRAVGMALVICMGNLGGAIASNIFRSQDAPRYLLGLGIEIMFLAMGMIAVPIIALTYRRINARKDALQQQGKMEGSEVLDKESFRYTL